MSDTVTLKAAVSALPPINKNLSITNSSSVEVTMLDGFGTDDSQVAYEQTLTQWTTTSGQKSIPAGSSGTIVLDDTHDNNGTPTYSKAYSIIYAKPTNLFPVKIKGSLLNFKTQDFTPVTITDADVTVMKQTENFLQIIGANPTSQLAQDYATAMKAATDSATSDTDVDDKVADFFAKTTNFQSVTIDAIITVSSYYKQFPYVWAAYQGSRTLYFYTSDGTTVNYSGSVTISVPTTATTDKSLPGFSFAYTDADNTQKPLYFVDGLFVDDKNSDVPAIALSGLFVLKSMLTKVDSDNVIVPILSGTINGHKVLGYETKATQNSDGSWSGLYPLLHPTNAAGALALFSTVLGLLFGIDFISKGLKGAKDWLSDTIDTVAEKLGINREDVKLSTDDVAAAKTSAEAELSPMEQRMQAMLDKLDVQFQLNQDLVQAMKDGQAQLKDQLNQEQKAQQEDEIEVLENELQLELDAGVNNTKLDNADDALTDAFNTIDTATNEQLDSVLEPTGTKLAEVKVDVDASFQKARSQADAEAKLELDQAKTDAATAETESETIDNQTKDAKEGNSGDDKTETTNEDYWGPD